MMDLFSIIHEGACTSSLKARSKEACLGEIARLIAGVLEESMEEEVLRGLRERESKGSTAFGEGIAIPHARYEILDARTPDAVKESFLRYASPDGAGARRRETTCKLLILTLYELKFFDDLVEIMVGAGTEGISVLDSAGSTSVLSRVPLFSEFLNFTGSPSGTSKTILAVIEEKALPSLIEDIEDILGDLDTHTGAHLMVVDIGYMKGSLEAL